MSEERATGPSMFEALDLDEQYRAKYPAPAGAFAGISGSPGERLAIYYLLTRVAGMVLHADPAAVTLWDHQHPQNNYSGIEAGDQIHIEIVSTKCNAQHTHDRNCFGALVRARVLTPKDQEAAADGQ
ncbi:MAG: hypothetical protein F4Y02_10640 [Chloroflexi bacterium]|nr:hypothetical protein [Chloroflexota bacterium]